ncbi:MAG: SRPBCC domain-containing protein [Saprospiraceae bacterium]
MQIRTEIQINATPEKVWNVLTDFSAYPEWNPFVKKLEGEVEVGKVIKVALPGMNFKPLVLKFETNKELRWLGHLFFKGLFDGEHSFTLIDNQDGTTTFIHAENFAGILVPVFKKMLLNDTKPGFEKMNEALKERVERKN